MTQQPGQDVRQAVIDAGASLLEQRHYETVTLAMVAKAAGLGAAELSCLFPTMHALGSAILSAEGETMRRAQRQALQETDDPLSRLCRAFRHVGESLAQDSVVRAGVRIAAEATHCFPERKINPFRTWEGFIHKNLLEAQQLSLLRNSANLADAAWLLTAAGMGTKDLLAFTGDWDSAPGRLESVAMNVVATLTQATEQSEEGPPKS